MNLYLVARTAASDGVFGSLRDDAQRDVCVTLEHSYFLDAQWKPKLPAGEYVCQRSNHYLHGMVAPFETFEVLNVPGHTGILFHWGNYNHDSDGCILLGHSITQWEDGDRMITYSRESFNRFMHLQDGVDSFTLVVRDM